MGGWVGWRERERVRVRERRVSTEYIQNQSTVRDHKGAYLFAAADIAARTMTEASL